MNEPNHHQIATYLIDYALSELVKSYERAQSSSDSHISNRLRPERVGEIRDGGYRVLHRGGDGTRLQFRSDAGIAG